MFRVLIIGLGRAGQGLHLPVLRRLRAAGRHAGLFADAPFVAYDHRATGLAAAPDVHLLYGLAAAPAAADPDRTVVHLCTPPEVRLETLRELAELGYRRFLVEKPLAADPVVAGRIVELGRRHDLRLIVVAPWLASSLTARLHRLALDGTLGTLTGVDILQSKPRLGRTLSGDAHPTALDVEVPHSAGVALRLAGPARVTDATWTDMRAGERVVRRMGTARVTLAHTTGVRTEIFTDLTSPIRERRITLSFTGGQAVGYYPGSEADHYAHLWINATGQPGVRQLFLDDSLTAFMAGAYTALAKGADLEPELLLNVEVTRLLGSAKARCVAAEEAMARLGGPLPDLDRQLAAGVHHG